MGTPYFITAGLQRVAGSLMLAACISLPTAPAAAQQAPRQSAQADTAAPDLDHSGRKRKGKASFYGRKFYGQTMADGTPMDPKGNNAASKTLPLGTTARVTNLANGRSAVVEIRDRGPFVRGRIIDLSPATARKLGFGSKGVVTVEVAPLEVPQPDGSVKRVAGAGGRDRAAR
jgi:rare lipoprotein A